MNNGVVVKKGKRFKIIFRDDDVSIVLLILLLCDDLKPWKYFFIATINFYLCSYNLGTKAPAKCRSYEIYNRTLNVGLRFISVTVVISYYSIVNVPTCRVWYFSYLNLIAAWFNDFIKLFLYILN